MNTRQIFDAPPSDWRDLQQLVRQVFSEMGCEASCDVPLATVRGSVDVDVVAIDRSRPPVAIYLVECKLWKRRVPQSVIHAFRTVVADSGAHTGFIVSDIGFQEGAYQAVHNSNVTLLTWAEFQELFFERWVIARGLALQSAAQAIREFMHGMSDPIQSIVERSDEAQALWYAMFARFSAYVPWLTNSALDAACFPVTCIDPRPERNGYTTFTSAREYFDVLERSLPLIIAETERFVARFNRS
jgi:hypothetical protein